MAVLLFTARSSAVYQSFAKCLVTNSALKCPLSIHRPIRQSTFVGHDVSNLDLTTFQENLQFRKHEASRSILVQVQSAHSYKELHAYCSSFGSVKNLLHYSTGVEPMHFIIVEFDSEEGVHNAFSHGAYLEDAHAVPVQSQFLWFRAASKKPKLKQKVSKDVQLLVENGNSIFRELEIQEAMRSAADVTEQMHKLHSFTRLNDVGVRLRFLAAKQIEIAMSGMFPSAVAIPFGSSVNGYGKMGCDLDLVLKLNHKLPGINEQSRLVFHSKATMGSERSTSQRHMEAVGDILQLFLPGCSQVRRILQARVPIIKFYQQLVDVEVDLSMYNTSGVHMSDLLHLMGALDHRVRPLVFTVRKWAAETGLTSSSPGRWITNFSLTLLVLAFLQNPQVAILPSVNKLVQLATKDDECIAEEGLNCTFLRSPRTFLGHHPQQNQQDLAILLREFFEHYSSYDFQNKAISLNDGVPITKPDHSALYIVNPLERGLNVSKNVSLEELQKFKSELRNAAWVLESIEEQSDKTNWGILQLFVNKRKANGIAAAQSQQHRQTKLIEVSKLFDEDDFKNDNVRKEVDIIKKETKARVKSAIGLDLKSQR